MPKSLEGKMRMWMRMRINEEEIQTTTQISVEAIITCPYSIESVKDEECNGR
jgi:hypothetical protein